MTVLSEKKEELKRKYRVEKKKERNRGLAKGGQGSRNERNKEQEG